MTLNAESSSSLAKSRINRDGLAAGTPAPEFCLPGLYGGQFRLSDWRGKKVFLLFSDPNCGPCSEVAKELQMRHVSGCSAKIVAISRGELELNHSKAQELGLSFQILLQKRWEISLEYGIFATPVGYLIDEQGFIAKEVAVGGGAILSLVPDPGDGMKSKIENRLDELQRESSKGQEELRSLDLRRQYLVETMLRLSGARQVLTDLIQAEFDQPNGNGHNGNGH
jgi:peroxiredoxin